MNITILHVEDEPALANLVRTAFLSFGFKGDILAADGVAKALALLGARASHSQPLDLILSDMRLPDGTGLDLLRKVRNDPFWHLTPVILLSSDTTPAVVNEAYALGANCYVPKTAHSPLKSLRGLYECWMETALLPRGRDADRVQHILWLAINLRGRSSEIYLRMAELPGVTSDEMRFWLESSLNEGNLANLLALFRNKIRERELPLGIINRVIKMQEKVEWQVRGAERWLQAKAPEPRLRQLWALEMAETIDEEVLAEFLGYLFPKAPVATIALKERAAVHLKGLATFILAQTVEPELQERAEKLLGRAERLAAASCHPAGTASTSSK